MIDLSSLNNAQRDAVTAPEGHVLVIAGAGSGKTRTLTHRLAWLTEQGISPSEILLLAFTRKASQEMLFRAQALVQGNINNVIGGTFHGFAYSVLRRRPPVWATGPITIIDVSDATSIIKQCRETLGLGKDDPHFPKSSTIQDFLSKARNKELSISTIIENEAQHLQEYLNAIESISPAYTQYKHEHNLLDYDDLLFELEALLVDKENPLVLPFRHILVDEYQDTNKVQARLVQLLARTHDDTSMASVMAVGDDAQSIYAFRGANVRNILDFPNLFPNTRIVKLEENYRSTRPILEAANSVLEDAREGYSKNLFTSREGGKPVRIIRTFDTRHQAIMISKMIELLLDTYRAPEIAVLFRSGRHSFQLEGELKQRGILFNKFGGIKASETKHVKDVLSFARLLVNPLDMPSFLRIAMLCTGIGQKTAQKLYHIITSSDGEAISKAVKKYTELGQCLSLLEKLQAEAKSPHDMMKEIVDFYRPFLVRENHDDWPVRMKDLNELVSQAPESDSIADFVARYALDSSDDTQNAEHSVVLSTIHSAKGLEWDAVILLDLVEGRFPSYRAVSVDPEEFEEERRLMYVACTRARQELYLCVPNNIISENGDSQRAIQSPFLAHLSSQSSEEWFETYSGQLTRRNPNARFSDARTEPERTPSSHLEDEEIASPAVQASIPEKKQSGGYCRHKIFGRGKIIEIISPDKCRVNFPGMGMKVIITRYLTMED